MEDVLERVVSTLWLRPERAFLDAVLYHDLSSPLQRMLEAPSLDLGAGEGTPTFLALGGALAPCADEHVQNLVSAARWCLCSDEQMHASAARSVNSHVVARAPSQAFTRGQSFTERQVELARQLGVHGETVSTDYAYSCDFGSGYKFLFAPNLHWVTDADLGHVMARCLKALAPGGKALLVLPNRRGVSQAAKVFSGTFPVGSTVLLPRQPIENFVRNSVEFDEVALLAKRHGCSILSHSYSCSQDALLVYFTGLRGLFRSLQSMAAHLTVQERRMIKSEWCEAILDALGDIFVSECVSEPGELGAWHIIAVERTE